jgi:xanthine dehydrogenase accessory factor
MKEIQQIIHAYELAQTKGVRTALATVVHVDGSSYRRPGARMLISEEGDLTGSISGGCLEGDALRKALLVINAGKAMLVTYDTSDEDDAAFGMGLGCNGIIQVLIEPLATGRGETIVNLLKEAVASRQKSALVTLFSLEDKKSSFAGTCLLVTGAGRCFSEAPLLQARLVEEAQSVLEAGKSTFRQYDTADSMIAFTEIIVPPVSLVVAGAGNDVFPLVDMAGILGWETTIIDGRPQYAKKERFAAPSCKVILSKPEDALKKISVDEYTVFVLMTHNYNYDLAMLRALVGRKITYIGILGPKKKMEMMKAELASAGIELPAEVVNRIHGPVGLDIGAETAEEIALSILAEIKSVLAARLAHPLRNANGTIHDRAELVIGPQRI